ncbi:LysR family transcriptional regulator [[Pseudomonas] boreopolis]|uniref:LysR family transcriptional regulator n=1 Tax=Xanthomonas boreopolis TaxID=86183 RepID=UPI003D9B065E
MDWDDLRHFVAFADAGSLAGAARRLQVEHATVARRIAALEETLQLKLVDRRTRSYVLTADGERIARLGRDMEAGAQAVLRAAAAGQQEVAGTVSLSAPPATATTLLTPHFGELYRRHPAIRLRVIAETRMASLRSEVDLAIRLGRPDDPELVVRRLQRMTFSYYAAPSYLARTAPEDYVFIGYDESLDESPQQRQMRAFAAGRPLVLRSNSSDVQRGAVRAGVGVALLGDLPGNVDDPGLVPLPGGAGVLERELWLVVHRDLRRAPAVRAVAEFLVQALAEPG